MNKKRCFLLINGSLDLHWAEVLTEALIPLGLLDITTEAQLFSQVNLSTYDLILLDSAAVTDVPSLVTTIRCRYPDARIVVVTASPTWRRARAAFKAGVIDYIRKSLDQAEIRATLQSALHKLLPPLPTLALLSTIALNHYLYVEGF